MELGGMMDAVIFGCGVYLLYSALVMKAKGELKAGWLVSKSIDLSKSRDLPGYIAYMYTKTIIFSVFTILYAGIGLISAYVTPLGAVQLIAFVLFFFAVIWFGVISFRATKQFLT